MSLSAYFLTGSLGDAFGVERRVTLTSGQFFAREDPSPDAEFYQSPRLVTHIDEGAVAAVTELYRETIPPNGRVLDLMSSWVSHLPPEAAYAQVAGLGMNGPELRANSRLDEWRVQDLNEDPVLPYPDEAFDAVLCCVSVQYLTWPVEVFAEARRVTAPGGRVIVTFSNRMFPTKAVWIWRATDDTGHQALVSRYLEAAGWADVRAENRSPRFGDPLYAVFGTALPA